MRFTIYGASKDYYACWTCVYCGAKNVSKAEYRNNTQSGYYAVLYGSKNMDKMAVLTDNHCGKCGKSPSFDVIEFANTIADVERLGYSLDVRNKSDARKKLKTMPHKKKIEWVADYYRKYNANIWKEVFKCNPQYLENYIVQFSKVMNYNLDEMTETDYKAMVAIYLDAYYTDLSQKPWSYLAKYFFEKYTTLFYSVDEAYTLIDAHIDGKFDDFNEEDFTPADEQNDLSEDYNNSDCDVKYCNQCGKQIKPGSKFCSYCGADLR